MKKLLILSTILLLFSACQTDKIEVSKSPERGFYSERPARIWGETMTAPWSGDYTTNGNLPVVISHYLQANTPELMLPLFNRIESYMTEFEITAKEMFGTRGIHFPSRFSTHGLNNHFDKTRPMTFWTTGAAWYSMFYTESLSSILLTRPKTSHRTVTVRHVSMPQWT